MSMFEPSGIDPNPNSYDPNLPESDFLACQIPPDPLLESGTFIDRVFQNGYVDHATEPSQYDPSGSEQQERTPPVAEKTSTAAEPPPSRPPMRGSEEAAAATVPPAMVERPDWLPEGWRMDLRVRSSGVTAGTTDRYYVDPASGCRFRSKKEVFHFLETGSKRKRKPNPDADVMPSESPGGHKEKKASSTTKNPAPLNFDFKNPPEEVTWNMIDVPEDLWAPSIGDEMVPESGKQEWAAVFDRLCHS